MIAILFATLLAAGAPAAPKAFTGAWYLGRDGEGADTCRVRLNAAPVIGGFQLVAAKACAKVTPRAADLYAWYVNPEGAVVMADPTRRAVLVLKPLVKGVWATEGGDFDRLLLQRR